MTAAVHYRYPVLGPQGPANRLLSISVPFFIVSGFQNVSKRIVEHTQ